jgi:hypothetical protein
MKRHASFRRYSGAGRSGQRTVDAVKTLGSGVDGSVRLHTTNYNSQGDVYQMSAYADTGGMTLVNQVQDEYNGLGQLTGEYQADSGAVSVGSTPENAIRVQRPNQRQPHDRPTFRPTRFDGALRFGHRARSAAARGIGPPARPAVQLPLPSPGRGSLV